MRISPTGTIAVVLLFVACSGNGTSTDRAEERQPGKAAPQVTANTTARTTAAASTGKSSTAADRPAPYWPRFHGADGANKSPDTGLLKRWPAGGPPLVWTARGIGHGFSSVTLADGSIFTAGNIDEKSVVTALDLNGKIQWQTPAGKAWTKSHSGTRDTPTYDDRHLYYESPFGEVTCLDAKTGKKVWSLNILDKFKSPNIEWGLAESPLIDGDHLICCPGGKKTSVVALDKRTGKVVWAAKATGIPTSYASPVLAEQQGLRMILTMNSKALIGVDADSGNLLFEFPHITKYDINALMPLYHDGKIFVSSGYGSGSALVKVTVHGKQAKVDQVWSTKEMDNHHGGVILLDGYIYGAASARNNAKWICLDWATGAMKYAARGVGKGSVTYADGMLYTLSEHRKMGLVKPNPDKFDLVSKFTIPAGGEGPSWAHPVVCGGRLYIRHGDYLYTYDVRAR